MSARDRSAFAVTVQQALLGRHDPAGAVAIDRTPLEHPVAGGDGKTALLGKQPADILIAGQVVFVTPAR